MAFPVGWSGKKILIEIKGGFNDSDIVNFPLHVRWFDYEFPDDILSNQAKDIRFSSDFNGYKNLDFKLLSTTKIDVIINVPYVSCKNGAEVYMWWGNNRADYAKVPAKIPNPYRKGRLQLRFKNMY